MNIVCLVTEYRVPQRNEWVKEEDGRKVDRL